MVQPLPPRPGRRTADTLAAAALILGLLCYIARWLWVRIEYDRFGWDDGGMITTVIVVVAAAIWLAVSGTQVARVAGGIAAGTIVLEQIGYLFSSVDGGLWISTGPWSNGGWLTVPSALFVLGAIAALLAASSEAEKNTSPQPTVGTWPQPPTPGSQQPAGYPGQQQPPPHYQPPHYQQYQQPPSQWPQQ